MYDRNAILAAVDLRCLADEVLGQHAGGERNPTWICPNPQHVQTGRTPPVNVFTSHRGEQRWRCHGCGDGGTAIDLLMASRGLDLREALRHLADRAGHLPQPPEWPLRDHPLARPAPAPTPAGRDQRALGAYVDACERALWRPEGETIRRWLTDERALPAAVLQANHVGADLGPNRQNRPEGMCRTAGAVLPAIAGGRVVYAQVRVPRPRPDRPKYMNPTADLAPNPRIARFRPPTVEHPEVLITEGAIDALSATAAGYRAVAVLSAGYPDQRVAHGLSRLPYPLVIAFDADAAGRLGAQRLAQLLDNEQRPSTVLDLRHGDLNDALRTTPNWTIELPRRLQTVAATRTPAPAAHSLSR